MPTYFLAYLHSLGFSQKSLVRIFATQENYEDFYNNLSRESLKKLGLKDDKIGIILEKKQKLDTEKISYTLRNLGVRIITLKDDEYPELLRQTSICPYFLYVRGHIQAGSDYLSVVGARKSTPYSRQALSLIIPDLVRAGYGIVSWWAYGVDSIAHKITLENNGYTTAVFGTGIDGCYPKENRELFEQIIESGGALISPFPIGTIPEAYNFPIRNEIVAGMSRGVIVTEAAEKSGTLITARLALDFGRDVFALPGEITKAMSIGTNAIIRDGQAKLILSAEDILSEYQSVEVTTWWYQTKSAITFDDAIEEAIYTLLSSESLDASAIGEKLTINITTIAFRLSMMEVKGLIEMGIGGEYEVR